jgi:Tol biopolymer transport system component
VTPDLYRRAQEIFASAVTRSAESRAGYLDGACGNDVELRREVESLLASHDSASTGFLEQPAIEGMEFVGPAPSGRKPLSRGSRLGSFEILGPLGAGGMGEVYRARDPRLGRDVAIKVLPLEVASDKERLKRFEKEARSASALNHPNIVTIYETGTSDGLPWIAMEHVEGETLRTLLTSGALQTKKLLSVAVQIAEGLARAHEAGIVHRDLKPENVMVTKDGLVKILDFGLAKLQGPVSGGSDEESQLPTVTGTSPGIVLGTVGYMSPEQASGKLVDYRSDQFSLGSILYEMATGRRAFHKKTAVDTLAAILNEEPESIARLKSQAPAPLRWIIERCLTKEPSDRYIATRDLARELATVQGHLTEAVSGAVLAETPGRGVRPWIPWAAAVALAGAAYAAAAFRPHRATSPSFQNVTFQQGYIWHARFAPDGQTIVYAMIGIGDDLRPAEVFSTRAGSLDPRPLGFPPGDIFSISKTGRIAVGLARNPLVQEPATLAEASLTGGAPRPIAEDIWGADWSPDGKELAVVHFVGPKRRVEYPIGKVLYETTEWIQGPRISPNGEFVAFTEWREAVRLLVVDRRGVVRTLAENIGIPGPPCWTASGEEIWWSSVPNVSRAQATELHAVSLKGAKRIVSTLPGEFGLHDIAADGRLLLEHASKTYTMLGTFPGQPGQLNLDWLDQSTPADLSRDGKLLMFGDRGDAGSATQGAYFRKTDGSPAVRLGEGSAGDFSPDGKWTLVCRKLPKHYLVLIPVGAGEEKVIERGTPVPNGNVRFHPDGTRVIYEAAEPGGRERVYEQKIDGGAPRPLTGDGVNLILISPDGKAMMTRDEGAKDVNLVPLDANAGPAARAVSLQSTYETPIHWSADGRSVLVLVDANTRPFRVDRLDLATGHRELWKTFSPPGPLGAGGLEGIVLTEDEKAWVVGYQRLFSELLVADGLK